MLRTFVLMIALSTQALASQEGPANITQGHWDLGGSVSFNRESNESGFRENTLRVSTPIEYFVVDRLSLGGSVFYTHVSGSDTSVTGSRFNLGPTASYYFWSQDQLATFATAGFGVGETRRGNSYRTASGVLGLAYFLSPAVALRPSVFYEHIFGTSQIYSTDHISFQVGLGIYL